LKAASDFFSSQQHAQILAEASNAVRENDPA
jgi:hypothetical protein